MPDPAFASDPLDFDIAIEPIAPPPIAPPPPAAATEQTAAEREAVRLEVVRDAGDPLNEADPFAVTMAADAPMDSGSSLDVDLPSATTAATEGAAAGWADAPDGDAAATGAPVAASAAPTGLLGRVLAMVPGLGALPLGRSLRLPAGSSAGNAGGALRGSNLETLRTVGMVAALVLVALFAGRAWSASSGGRSIDQAVVDQLSEEVAALTVRLDEMDARAAQAAAAAHAAPSLPATAYSFQPPDPAAKKAEASDSPWQKFNLGATSTVSGGASGATATPTPASTSGNRGTLPDGRPLYTNGQNVYNCSDFKTWEDAQAVLEANRPGDPNILDIAGTGVACPALKRK